MKSLSILLFCILFLNNGFVVESFPYKRAAIGTGVGVGAVIAAPAALSIAGFKALGIAAGSLGSYIMSLYGGAVPAGSVCAVLQSAGAAGIALGTKVAMVATGTVVGAANEILKKAE